MQESTESFIAAEAAGHTWERRSSRPGDHQVLGHTQNWLNALPAAVQPVHLPLQFPRIVNELAELWGETAALDDYFEEKNFSPREGRTGFSPVVKSELLVLQIHSLRSRPVPYEDRVPRHVLPLG